MERHSVERAGDRGGAGRASEDRRACTTRACPTTPATSWPRGRCAASAACSRSPLAGGAQAARAFAESTELFQLAESLGGVESLIGYPSEMTHASVRGTELEVPDNVVRLSVGIEGVDDLLADVLQALKK